MAVAGTRPRRERRIGRSDSDFGLNYVNPAPSPIVVPDTPALDTFNAGALQALSTRTGWGSGHFIGTDFDLKTDATPTKASTSLGVPASNVWATNFTSDHCAWFTFGASTGSGVQLMTRLDSSTTPTAGYMGVCTNFGTFEIRTRGGTTLASITTTAAAAGDSYRFCCFGTVLQLDRMLSGSGVWDNLLVVADATHTTGAFIGTYVGSGTPDIDTFGGSALPYVPSISGRSESFVVRRVWAGR